MQKNHSQFRTTTLSILQYKSSPACASLQNEDKCSTWNCSVSTENINQNFWRLEWQRGNFKILMMLSEFIFAENKHKVTASPSTFASFSVLPRLASATSQKWTQVKTLHSKKFACQESIWKWLFFLPQFTGIVVKMWSHITPSNKLLDFSLHLRRICKLLPRPWLFLPGCFFST